MSTAPAKASSASVSAATSPRSAGWGDVLALGFGTTTAAWGLLYLLALPAVSAPTWLLTTALALATFGGGVIAGRLTRRGWPGGLRVGLLSGMLNLLVLSSALGRPESEVLAALPIFALASLAASAVLGLLGGAIGNTMRARQATLPDWNNAFVAVAFGATALLIAAGGLVTSHRAGMAVPDWPQSFGYNMFLLPLSHMADRQVFLEHAHRLLGALVGLTTLTLAVHLTRARISGAVTALAWAVFVAVAAQGVLGGMRVVADDIMLGAIHGFSAQLIFAGLAALLVLTSPRYAAPPRTRPGSAIDRTLPVVFSLLLLVQLGLGVHIRHSGLDNLVMLHIVVAGIVLALAILTGIRCWGIYPELTEVRKTGLGLIHVTGLQALLGLGAFMMGAPLAPGEAPSIGQAIVATLHQLNAALLLAMGVRLICWTRRLITAEER